MLRIRIPHPENLFNEVYLPYLFSDTAVRIFFGGSASGKSVFVAEELVLGVTQGRNVLCARKVARTLRGSCWNEVLKAIAKLELQDYFEIGKSEMVITCKLNDCQFAFIGLDDVEHVKSITSKTGVFTDVWIEEATEIEYEDYKQLDKRLRGESKHKKRITFTFNPIYKTHWLYTEFFGGWDENKTVYKDDKLLILKTTYKDNKFLTQADRDKLANESDPYYRNVYTLGNWGVLGDVIFRNWRVEDLREQIKNFDNIRNGLDFGFSSDPAAYVKLSLDKMRKKIYIYKEFYERGYTNAMLIDVLKPLVGRERLIADSAEPKSIAEIKGAGVNITGALKGADSVVYGIQFLQGYEIIVDIHCQNVKNELSLYQWRKDKDGNSIRQPVDKNNHLIDALRYALSEDMKTSTLKWGW